MATAAAELKKKTQSFKMGGASGFVPGTGSGDKVEAKYEPGEFVVSRDMLALDPKLGAHLSSLREMALAKQGMTPKQADAKAMMGGRLHAARGFGPDDYRPNFTMPQDVPEYRAPLQLGGPAPGTALQVNQRPNFTTPGEGGVTGNGRPSYAPPNDRFTPPPQTADASPRPSVSAEAAHGERVNPTPRPAPASNYVSPGVGGRDPFAPQAPATARPAPAPSMPTPNSAPVQGFKAGVSAQQGVAGKGLYATGRVLGSAAKLANALGPAATGVGIISNFNDYKINDPQVDSSAGGTWNALASGDFSGAGHSLSKGALEAGMDLGSFAANTLDYVVPGKAPVSTAYDKMLRDKFGDQLTPHASVTTQTQAAASAQNASTAPTPATTPATPLAKQAGGAQAAPAPAPEANTTGKVQVTRQPNGTMEFSGKDITGDPQYTGTTDFKAGGFGVSSLGGPIAPSAASQAALTNPDGSRWSAQDSAVMAANMRDGIDAYRGTSRQPGQAVTELGQTGGFGILDNAYKQRRTAEMPLDSITANKSQKSAAAAQLQAIDAQDMQRLREGGDTARAAMGNATTAANNKTVNDMTRQRLGFDAQRVAIEGQKAAGEQLAQGFGLRASQRMEDVQKVLLDPNATPEARKLAKSTMAAMNNKAAADRVQMVNMPDTVDANGTKIGGGQVPIRMNEDGTIEQVPIGAQQQAKPIPAAATADLKANPKMAADFDAKYGAGAAAKILGQK